MDVDVGDAGDLGHLLPELLGDGEVASRLTPTTWTLIGAGRPKSRIWLVMSAGWKKNVQSGNRWGNSSRSRAT